MGIPRLTSHIQPYLVPIVLGCSTTDCEKHLNFRHESNKLIIDGPGLAYYLYYRLLAHKSDHLNGFDGIPSYDELGKATIAFLGELQKHHVEISKIYFDGSLPAWKRDIRLSRMERNRQDIFDLHSLSPKGFPTSSSNSEPYQIKPWHLFDTSRLLPSNLKSIPAPPFMVPAILDALSTSVYAAVTEVVPDEADPYCARAAKENGGTVLTSDSDMLVYDLGERGAVTFLNGLELLHPSYGSAESCLCGKIMASICRPSDLMRRLNVESFQRVCFEIKEDPSITFPMALKLAKLPVTKPQRLQHFLEQYNTSSLTPVPSPQPSAQKKHFLDPQTSDLLLQTAISPDQSLHIYLLTLFDDPSKTSAWSPSDPLRLIAFAYASSTSLDHYHHRDPVLEHSRRGTRIVAENISTLSDAESIAYAASLSERIQMLRNAFPDLLVALRWRLFALHEILAWYDYFSTKPPSTGILVRALTGTASKLWGWEDVHFEAQVQGILYSLRVLGQVLRRISPEARFKDHMVFQDLSGILEELPPLAEVLPSRLGLALQVPRDFNGEGVLNALMTMFRPRSGDIEPEDDRLVQTVREEAQWEHQKQPKKSGKKRKGERKREEEKIKRAGGINPFSVLEYA